jgi:hypothetical protein
MEENYMNYRTLNDNDLASYAANILALLMGTELDAIDPAVRTDLVTAFGTLPATLATQSDAAVIAEDVRIAAVADRNDTRFRIHTLIGQVRDALKAGLASKSQFSLCGLDFAGKGVGVYVAQDPTELSGTGASNGVNNLKFSGNNKPTTVSYEVYRRQGDEGPWGYLGSTRKQQYTDTPVTPGQYYEYKVRAVAANSVSNYSNSAVVYGAL